MSKSKVSYISLELGNSVSWGIGGIFITEEAVLNGQ